MELAQKVSIKVNYCRPDQKAIDYKHPLRNWNTMEISRSQAILYNSKNYATGPVGEVDKGAQKVLAKVIYNDDNIYLVGDEQTAASHSWRVLNSYCEMQSATQQSINPGDIFKLGRVRFKVRKISWKPQTLKEEPQFVEHSENPDTQCRVCLNEERSAEDPLLSVCNCRGTLQYIHLSCLQHIIDSRSFVDTYRNSISLNWHDLNCRVCRGKFVINLKTPWLSRDLIRLPNPSKPYVILEKLHRNGSKMITFHLLFLRKIMSIGSDPGADLPLQEQSTVCPIHAYLKVYNDELILMGGNTRFATAVQLIRPILLESRHPILLECGRHILQIMLMSRTEKTCCFSFFRSRSSMH